MKKKKCPSPSSSFSYSCSEDHELNNSATKQPLKPNKPKRVRAKKSTAENSATSSSKSRSSIYRGVTRHRWTGRFEAHLWDKTTWNSIQNKRGRQVYLGAYDNEEDAARTYDLAALKYWGANSTLNFPLETYTNDMEEMLKLSKEECLASLRRRSSGFSRGISKYRGVARHHHNGRWEARIGNVSGNKYLYLGTYSTQEEAAVAYDMAALEFRGPNAVTNFHISSYTNKLKEINVEVPEVQAKWEEEVQVKQENGELVNKVQVDEAHDQNDNNVQVDEARDQNQDGSIPKLELIDFEAMAMMDPTEEHLHEHPWNFFLDIGFNLLPIPDIKASELHGLFDEKGFEENIEFIFDESFEDSEFQPDAMSTTSGGCKVETNASVKRQDSSTSLSSSSSSTTTSVSSNT